MSAKSRESAKAIDRSFDADVLAKARWVADSYQVILGTEDGRWYGRGLELPHVFGDVVRIDGADDPLQFW